MCRQCFREKVSFDRTCIRAKADSRQSKAIGFVKVSSDEA